MAAKEMLQSASKQETDTALPSSDIVRLAAEKSQLMDDLLDEEPIPSDYGQVMVGLFHGLSQDVYTRDFAVQVASSLSLLKRLADDPNRRRTPSCASRPPTPCGHWMDSESARHDFRGTALGGD